MDQETFTIIQNAVNAAIADAEENKEGFSHESINWADLKCVEVAYCQGSAGTTMWAAHVEEAHPECPLFAAYITKYVADFIGINIEVETAW